MTVLDLDSVLQRKPGPEKVNRYVLPVIFERLHPSFHSTPPDLLREEFALSAKSIANVRLRCTRFSAS